MTINLHPTSARAAWVAAVEVHAAAVARTFDALRDAYDPETYEDGGSPEEIAGDVTNVVGKVLAGDIYTGYVTYAASDAADAAEFAACDDYIRASARTPENVARAAVESFWQAIGVAFPGDANMAPAPETVAAFDAAALAAVTAWVAANVGGQA